MARRAKPAAPVVDCAPKQKSEEHWAVEKRVRIELLVSLAVTIGGFVWYAARADEVLRALAERVSKIEISAAADASQRSAISERITRIEGKQELTLEILNRVERELRERNGRQK